jgi:hypothetical protein
MLQHAHQFVILSNVTLMSRSVIAQWNPLKGAAMATGDAAFHDQVIASLPKPRIMLWHYA